MRKLVYILFLLFCVACTDDTSFVVDSAKDKTTFSLSLQVPEMKEVSSRSFEEIGPSNYKYPLHVIVFDGNGFFIEAVEATPLNYENKQVLFNVALHPTKEKRILHFVLNSPIGIDQYNYGTEVGLVAMGLLNTSGNVGAYWQRIEFPDGLAKDEATLNKFTAIPMLRNFAKITVTNEASKQFKLINFVVMNVPDKGTVAPYLMNNTGGEFATFYNVSAKNEATLKDYQTLLKEGYEGFEPSDMEFLNKDANTAFKTALKEDTPYFMYERRNKYFGDTHPTTFIVVHGKYNKTEDCYYKIDFVYPDDEGFLKYYNILRGFHYNVVIKKVNASGKATAADAASHPAGNNLTAAVEINHLVSLADGKNMLQINLTDTTVVNDGTIQLRFKYSDISNHKDLNDQVKIAQLPAVEDCIESISTPQNDPNNKGWRFVDVTLKGTPTNSDIITNAIKFYVTENVEGKDVEYLSRVAKIHLRKPLDMFIECVPPILPEGKEEQLKVNILIPEELSSEEDPYQLFPLVFYLEAEKNTLYPDVPNNQDQIIESPSSLPVNVRPSIFTENQNKQAIGYMRTVVLNEFIDKELEERKITLDDGYSYNYKVFPVCFKTNAVASASRIKCYNKYFILKNIASFENTSSTSTLKNVEINDGSYYGPNRDVTLTFTAGTAGDYTVSSDISGFQQQILHLNAGGKASIKAKTSTWSRLSKFTITKDGVSLPFEGSVRNKLAMKAQTLTADGKAVSGNTELRVYADEEKAKRFLVDESLGKIKANDLKNKTTNDVVIPRLEEISQVWFAYRKGNSVYYASTTAKELDEGTAKLNFNKIWRIEGVFTNDMYYGTTRQFTFELITYERGVYKIKEAQSNATFNTPKITLDTASDDGKYHYLIQCTPKTWSDAATITVSDSKGNSQVFSSTHERNLLAMWITSIGYQPWNDTWVNLYGQGIDSTMQWYYGYDYWLYNENVFEVSNLGENEEYKFSYSQSGYSFWCFVTAKELAESTSKNPAKLDF